MKKVVCSSLFFAAVLFLASCGSSQKMPQASKAEIENPYGTEISKTEAEQYALDMPGKRASGKGVSASESAARQMAELDARAQFSRALDNAILDGAKRMNARIKEYAGGDNDGMNNIDEGENFTAFVKNISSNIVANTNVVKMNKFYNKNRQYTIFVCLEYNGSVADIAQKATEQLQQRVPDANREKWGTIFKEFQQELENDLKKKKL